MIQLLQSSPVATIEYTDYDYQIKQYITNDLQLINGFKCYQLVFINKKIILIH